MDTAKSPGADLSPDTKISPNQQDKQVEVQHVKLNERPPKRSVKYTPQRVKKLCAYVAMGMPMMHAAAAVGVSDQTVRTWKEKHPDFAEKLKAAEAEFMNRHLDRVDRASEEDGALSLKLLKARFPEYFSDGEKAVSVRMQVEGRIDHQHEAVSLEEAIRLYAGAIAEVSGQDIVEGEYVEVEDRPGLPAGDAEAHGTG